MSEVLRANEKFLAVSAGQSDEQMSSAEAALSLPPSFLCARIVLPVTGWGPHPVKSLIHTIDDYTGPAVLAIKEIHHMFSEDRTTTAGWKLYRWISGVLEDGARPRVVMFTSTADLQMPHSFLDQIDVPIYLPMPDEFQAAEIFEQSGMGSVELSQAVARTFFEIAQSTNKTYTGSSLVHGTRALMESGDLNETAPEKIAFRLSQLADPVDPSLLAKHEEKVELLKARADLVLRRWQPGSTISG